MAATLADDNFRCIFLNENGRIPIRFSLKVVPRSQIDNTAALAQIMAWRRSGYKPLSEPLLICFTDIYAALGEDELRGSSTAGQSAPSPNIAQGPLTWQWTGNTRRDSCCLDDDIMIGSLEKLYCNFGRLCSGFTTWSSLCLQMV